MEQKKPSLVYLLAASHSGSTLSAMLIAAHPELRTVGELKAIHLGEKESYLCSCRSRLLECDFWQKIHAKMQAYGINFDVFDAGTDIRSGATKYTKFLLSPLVRSKPVEFIRDFLLFLSPTWRRQYKLIQEKNESLIRAIQETTGATHVVDSSKIGIRLKYLLKNKNIDIKVIWVVRDGRGVSLAYSNPSEYADAKDPLLRGGGAGRTQEQAREIVKGAHEWKRCNEEASSLTKLLGDGQWIQVKYEDLCNSTENTLKRVYQFIDVDPNKLRLDFKSVDHHVLGNGMRLDSTEEIKLDDRWTEELSDDELSQFDEIAGDLNRSFGYDT